MLSILVLSLIFVVNVSSNSVLRIPTQNQILRRWNSYSSNLSLDERTKFENFKDNYLKVLAHNYQHSHNKTTFKTKLNDFSMLKHGEFLEFFIGKLPKVIPNVTENLNITPPLFDLTRVTYTASSFDWRSYGVVTPVKYQSSCGACWAFATTGAVEALYSHYYGQRVDLSEQELVDCTRTGYAANSGCDGGLPSSAFYHAYSVGLVDESIYPYTATTNYYCASNSNMKRYKVRGYANVPYGDEETLRRALATYGPVTVAIDASDWAFTAYSSGVYYSTNCYASNVNHAVLVVGYGTDPGGMDFWIIKNSWGPSWGMNGYGKIARNRNMCGIATLACYAYL